MLCIWSGIGATDGRGKIGGSVASKCKSGNYWKVKKAQKKHKASRVNVYFSELSTMWRTITPVQREWWNNYALTKPYQNIYGQSKFLSGFNYFMRIQTNLKINGATGFLPIPYTDDPPGNIKVSGFTFQSSTSTASITVHGITSRCSVWVFCSAPVSVGISAIPPMVIVKLHYSTFPNIDFFSEYLARYGQTPAAGTKKLFSGVVCINFDSGQTTIMQVQSVICT